jgi:hypothetical protein
MGLTLGMKQIWRREGNAVDLFLVRCLLVG